MKYSNSFGVLLLLFATVCFCSCGDDDDDIGGGKAPSDAGVLDKNTGLRVKGFENYKIYYDDKGHIDYIRDNYGQWEFSYNPNKITYLDNSRDEEETITVGYNKSGYLSGLSESYSGEDEYEKWKESSQVSLSYDNNGHLIKISGSGKESGIRDGERYNETWTFSYTLTWRNNLLRQVVWTEKEIEDGETETETETWTFSYDNDNYENAYCQWAPSIAGYLEGLEEVLAYVGLLGVGPTMLPSSAERDEEEYYDGKSHTYNNSYSFRYGFNNDGTIAYTYVNSSRYNFSYDYAEINSKNTRAAMSMEDKDIAEKLHHLFKRTHKKH